MKQQQHQQKNSPGGGLCYEDEESARGSPFYKRRAKPIYDEITKNELNCMNRNSEATFVINYKVRDWLRLKKFSHYSVICCKDPFIHSSPGLLFPMADIFYALALGRWLLGWQTVVVVVLVVLLLIQEDCILPHLDWTLLDSLANGSIPE